MTSIIVVFSKIENAKSVKNILVRGGFEVVALCTTGAQALQVMNDQDGGIVVCGCRFQDMNYQELFGYLPNGFQMLLLASPQNWSNRAIRDLVCLAMPLKVHELLQTIEMMLYAQRKKRKKKQARPKERTKEERQCIQQAKELLMQRNNFTEEEAHRYIQKTSMDSGNDMVETSRMILSMMTEFQ